MCRSQNDRLARRHVRLFQGHQFLDRFAMGAIVAVTALALQGRGLGVGEIGAPFAVYAATTIIAELPFGGLGEANSVGFAWIAGTFGLAAAVSLSILLAKIGCHTN